MEWFKLKSNGVPTKPSDYNAVGTNPPPCLGIDKICAVQAEKEGNEPIFTEELKDEMILALHSRSSSATVLLEDS